MQLHILANCIHVIICTILTQFALLMLLLGIGHNGRWRMYSSFEQVELIRQRDGITQQSTTSATMNSSSATRMRLAAATDPSPQKETQKNTSPEAAVGVSGLDCRHVFNRLNGRPNLNPLRLGLFFIQYDAGSPSKANNAIGARDTTVLSPRLATSHSTAAYILTGSVRRAAHRMTDLPRGGRSSASDRYG